MHILIGILTTLAGLIWALRSLQNAGVDLNAFNPFTWARRRQWEKKLGTKPMHSLTESMEAAALLVVSIAREGGEITRETKLEILQQFERAFGVGRGKAIELFSSSSYILQGVMNMADEVRHVLRPCKEQFQQTHVKKLLEMLETVAAMDHQPTDSQLEIIQAVEDEFRPAQSSATEW